ncbi:MAG: hypothetical protein AAGI50_07780 [Pseudomonadota bacterium]
MPIVIHELAATLRPEPEAVARDVQRRPATAAGAAERALRDLAIAKEREDRLAID